MKIIVAGATSHLAQEFIKLLGEDIEIFALIRSEKDHEIFKNYSNIFSILVDYDKNHYKNLLSLINKKDKLVFTNFSTLTIDGLFINQDISSFAKVNNANLMTSIGPLLPIVQHMIDAKWGRIILLSSTRGIKGDVGISPYAISKSSLSGLSNSLSKEYAKFNITSNVINLGYFDSPLWKSIPENKRKLLLKQIPSKRTGKAEDMIPLFHCLIESNYINGAHIDLDGGL
jgi:3-oxoacyl-[acyl-carrier protein] reductase